MINKKIRTIILLLVLVLLCGGCSLFSSKNNFNKLDKVILNENNQGFTLDDNQINLKVIDANLYINNKKIDNVFFEGTIFVTDKLIFIAQSGQCGYHFSYYIDKKANLIEITNNYQLENIKLENNEIVATVSDCFCIETDDNKCNEPYKVMIKYQDKVEIVKVEK